MSDREVFIDMLVRAGVDFADGAGGRTKVPPVPERRYGELDESVGFWQGGGIGGSRAGIVAAPFQDGRLLDFWTED